jgi:iron complex transport system permease protein
MTTKKKYHFRVWIILVIALLLPVFILLDLTMGSVKIPFSEAINILFGGEATKKGWEIIIWESRFPHSITAIFSGAALAVSGLFLQTLFRNPLAGPSVLGISSGASLGVALLFMGSSAIGINIQTMSGITYHALIIPSALIGALSVTLIIIIISRRIHDMVTILIAGMMIGYLISAVISVLIQRASQGSLQQFSLWGLGSFDGIGYDHVFFYGGIITFILMISFIFIKPLNLLLLGDLQAQTLGVNTKTVKVYIIFISSVLAALVTAYCGPIAFIGITVPHILRMILKTSDHRYLIPGCILGGALLCSVCSLLSRIMFSESVLPINAVTSLIGAPIVLWIILQQKKWK